MSGWVFIGVGSNIRPQRNIPRALRLLQRELPVIGSSTFYRTAPLGGRADPYYVNGVWQAAAGSLPDGPEAARLEGILKDIERRLGRVRSADRYASRPIDLDLVLAAGRVDPEVYRRPFLSLPLAELAPSLVLPDSGRRIAEVAASHREEGERMEPLPGLTAALRGLLLRDRTRYPAGGGRRPRRSPAR